MQLLAVAVVVFVVGLAATLIIAVLNGGPSEALAEGAFAVMSAIVGAIAGYSVQDKTDEGTGDAEDY
jgi:hypothetical protein